MQDLSSKKLALRDAKPANGQGLLYAARTSKAWWYSAWLRTLARFSRTKLGSFWMGLSNLLSVTILGVVYGTVLRTGDPIQYVVYLGFGITIWGFISQSSIAGSALFDRRRQQLVNNTMPCVFYCLDEWAFQLQTFSQAFAVILVVFSFLNPGLLINAISLVWLPMLNLSLFCFWIIVLMAVLGARFKDFAQLMPIILQLFFLISPILYKREGLGRLSLLADFNPFYQVLAPLREALINGHFSILNSLIILLLNIIMVICSFWVLRLLRYRLPLWV